MRGSTVLVAAKNFFKVTPIKRTSGNKAILAPKKEVNDLGYGGQQVTSDEGRPIVAFSKPPPLPPALGPILMLSFLEMVLSRDKKDE
ncbi:hypothetical protein FRX31_034651 [Thalictrum thalictroides]|uniref:Uncharacterized protein n=1 Tax=Thalictrum thalictroides TaxID=46969 RepID=A0A7J6UTH6_THATH|nr:hypothetical protein FRX31_034651 [Thalictrum thalictroides]